jgi:C1A family cysteine protease
MKKTLVLSVCLILSLFSRAQVNPKPSELPPFEAGARGKFGIADSKLFDQLLSTVVGVGSSSKELLAEQSLKAYMMPPRKTGNGIHSACYAITSALEYYVNLNNNYKDNLSPDYLRLSLPNGTIEDDLAFVATNGTVSAAILPYEASNLTPSVHSAVKYKIRNYLKLFQGTTRPQQKLYDLRKAITRGNPVIIEMQITNEFKNLRQARLWHSTDGDKTPAGTHYLIVVGYNEESHQVELLNSWGREWGNGGYIRMNYEDFSTAAVNGYVLLL